MCLVTAGCSGIKLPFAADSSQDQPAAVPTVLILDASGSMTENDAPGPRIDAAKAAARQLIDSLPDHAPLALQVYGTSTGSAEADKARGCQDVKVLLPLRPLDRQQMGAAIDGIAPSGYTPIALALQTAAEQLPAGDSPQMIVLVSDGEDTCELPPCPAAAQLIKDRPGLTISTVGFRVDGEAVEQLRCIAEATDGLFVQAANADQLASRLQATKDIDAAKGSLSPTGLFGLSLGDTAEQIRAKYPDFPEVGPGAVLVEWRDCDFGFVDGILDGIRPHDGGHTIDGVTVGTPLAKVVELYGQPLSAEPNGNFTTLIFDAGSSTTGAFRIDAKDYSENSGGYSGEVDSITLCRCKPQTSPGAVPPPAPTPSVNAADYRTKYGYGFASPSGKWWCDIQANTGLYDAKGAMIHGPGVRCEKSGTNASEGRAIGVPGAPLVPANDVRTNQVPPTSIGMIANHDPQFFVAGQAMVASGDPLPISLPYGHTLTAFGFTCNTQETGISCRHDVSGKAFSFSTEFYKWEYTPVPAGLPLPPAPPGEVVLGGPTDQYSGGYGTAQPDSFTTNSLCGNSVYDVTWDSWGGPIAHGWGTLCQNSGAAARGEPLQRVRLTASDIGDCQGKRAYRKLAYDNGDPSPIC